MCSVCVCLPTGVCAGCVQMQTPVLEVDQADGEDLVAEQLRTLQEMLQGVQLQYDKAAMELQEARIREEQ